MNLYRLRYHHDEAPSGEVSEWFVLLRSALHRATALRQDYPNGGGVGFYIHGNAPQLVDVPLRKKALAEWLTHYEP